MEGQTVMVEVEAPTAEMTTSSKARWYQEEILVNALGVMLMVAIGYFGLSRLHAEWLGTLTVLIFCVLWVLSLYKELRYLAIRAYVWVWPLFLVAWATHLIKY